MDRHCGQCGKTLTGSTPSRFYFEDDSWLCTDCFGSETAVPEDELQASSERRVA